MKDGPITTFLAGGFIGLIALAMDYFFLQHFFKTPVSMSGGITVVVVLIYLFVPFLILQFSGKSERIEGEK